MADTNYTALYRQSFVFPKRLATYDALINLDTKTSNRVRTEATHKARIADHSVYVTAERNTCQFILKAVEDTWVQELRESNTFYKMVKSTDFLIHLQSIFGGLHSLDVLALHNEIHRFHLEAEGIPDYINALEDAKKTSKRSGKTITNATFVMITTNTMLVNGAFPRANNEWEDIPTTSCT